MGDKKRDLERPASEDEYKEATLNQFFANPVWRSIEKVLKAQEDIAVLHLTNPDIDDIKDIMFFKGILNQLHYMKNIKLTLLEE